MVRAALTLGDASDDPAGKARRLANGIAEALHLALLSGPAACVIAIPIAIAWSLRRSKRR